MPTLIARLPTLNVCLSDDSSKERRVREYEKICNYRAEKHCSKLNESSRNMGSNQTYNPIILKLKACKTN